jgi:protein-S-isoprenylcysteine O-methyltransferase Ste14
VILAGWYLIFRVMKENTFLSRVVEIQEDRGHTVVTTGPYKVVRHPMYVGAIALLFAIPLALGSIYGLIPAVLMTIAFILRTSLEDKTLHAELQGYLDYAQQTKYRLLPGIW